MIGSSTDMDMYDDVSGFIGLAPDLILPANKGPPGFIQ